MLCSYKNQTPFLQIVRITNIAEWYFEKVVFSQQHILFDCKSKAVLEVYSSEFCTALLVERIACEHLEVETSEEYFDQTA